MHTQGKWSESGRFRHKIFISSDDGRSICTINDVTDNAEANAKRIVQAHNSHDDLLEVCKEVVSELRGKMRGSNWVRINRKAKLAIAQAEE